MGSILKLAQVVLIISHVALTTRGCFITNCPPGGKRADTEKKTHQCEQCGPPGSGGRCYGPQICCSAQFGCLVGPQVTSACQLETRSPSLCHNQAPSCGGSSETGPLNGQCAAVGVCCTPETCTLDDKCTTSGDSKGPLHLRRRPFHHHRSHNDDGGEDEETLVIPLIHGPVDLQFYRRLMQSGSPKFGSKTSAESAEVPEPLSFVPQGPMSPHLPSARIADYF